jgi:hypothetical protein
MICMHPGDHLQGRLWTRTPHPPPPVSGVSWQRCAQGIDTPHIVLGTGYAAGSSPAISALLVVGESGVLTVIAMIIAAVSFSRRCTELLVTAPGYDE